ncbi:MAG: type III pantothenate kinase [Spirochaetes bacterium]|nr:type III pantothenate kinase [Spirochaetota bacterium]
MTLTADVGNTHTVVGLWHEGNLGETLRLASDARRTADEWRLFLTTWLQSVSGSAKISRAILSSVVPAARSALGEAMLTMGVSAPHWVSCEQKLNFAFDYPQKQTLGTDRIVDVVAARHYFGVNCIVVDFGTAITFSVLTNGAFQGGVIAPGIISSLEALSSSAAKLPKIAFQRVENAIGKSTAESITIGAYVGWRGVVREILSELRRSLPQQGSAHKIIATGGISESLDFAPDFFDVVDKNLTLKGLFLAGELAAGRLAAQN